MVKKLLKKRYVIKKWLRVLNILYNNVINQIKNVQRWSCSRNVDARCSSEGNSASGVTSSAGRRGGATPRTATPRCWRAWRGTGEPPLGRRRRYLRGGSLIVMYHISYLMRYRITTCLCDLLSSYIEKGTRSYA